MKKLRLIILLILFNNTFAYSQSEKLDSLYSVGLELYEQKKYNDASEIFEECLTRLDCEKLDTTIICVVVLCKIAETQLALGNKIKAIGEYHDAFKLWLKVSNGKDYEHEALGWYILWKQIETILLNFYDRIDQKNYEAAVNNMEFLFISYFGIYEDYVMSGIYDYEKDDVIEYKKKLVNEYIMALDSLEKEYCEKGNYRGAADKWKKASDILSVSENRKNYNDADILKYIYSKYAYALGRIAVEEANLGNINESAKVVIQAQQIIDNIYEKCSFHNAWLLRIRAGLELKRFNYKEAFSYIEQAINMYVKMQDYGEDYIQALSLLADCELGLGNFEEARSTAEIVLENSERKYGKNTMSYCHALSLLGKCHHYLGKYVEGIHLYDQALSIAREKNDSANCATLLFNIAVAQYALGNQDKAIDFCEQALSTVSIDDSLHYYHFLNALAMWKCEAGKENEVIPFVEKSIYYTKNMLGENSVAYAEELTALAWLELELGNYESASSILKNVLDIIEQKLGKFNYLYGKYLLWDVECQSNIGRINATMINKCKESITIQENVYGHEHPFYVTSLYSVLKIFFNSKMTDELTSYSYLTTNVCGNIIIKYFGNLITIEREKFWSRYGKWFTEELNKYTYSYPTDTLCMTAYNGVLLSKGLLLNGEIELRKLLQESGDAVVDSLYEELRMNKVMLQRLYEKPKNERFLSTDSIEKIVDILEKQLLKRSKVYGDYTKNLRIDYKDVRRKLKDGDLAVEFCSFPLSKDSTMYMALVLRNDMEYPKMVPLFEEKQISKLRKDIYKGGYTATLVWKPLEQYLNKAKNVYFGPSGELYNIAIENIPHWSENCLMSDKWNIYRLSSTRELAVIRDKDVVRKASVYGGIMYDTGTDMLTDDTVRYGRQRSVFYGLYNLSDSLSVRGGVEYLPATKEEAEYVDDALKGRHIASTLRTDMQATEGAFKDMAGKRNNLLHIATHAFYWPEKEVATADKDFMFMPNMPQRYKEDKAMTRSGLILAGANNALRGMKLPEDVNDGILTAKEIAQLDLRGLDLVVLSACQTGLGEVTGDGVFGLQRGFKKAGANSLMMSLWSVDDEATSLFMKEFYRQLMAGNGKHESMKAAQRHVREYSEIDEDGEVTHPYENYKYWAAFVLLDAIR